MSNKFLIAPSLLAADPLNMEKDLMDVEAAGADWHHIDIMDGHFVPNLTYGVPLVKAMKKICKIPLDVHIMVSNPDQIALDFVKAGADLLSFHVEAATHSHRLLQAIRAEGALAGLAVNPGTPVEMTFPLLSGTDVVLLMSVNPGFGGQSYIVETEGRVAALRQEINRRGLNCRIEVDGGITDKTGALVAKAGADIVVAGTYVYGAKDRKQTIATLRDRCVNFGK